MGDRLGKLSAVVQLAVAGKGEVNNSYCNNGVLVYVRLVLKLVTYLKCTCFQVAPPLLSAVSSPLIMHGIPNGHARCVWRTGSGH